MLATRYENTATNVNLETLLALIADPKCEAVTLLASSHKATGLFGTTDGPETNLPLVAALAKYSIPEGLRSFRCVRRELSQRRSTAPLSGG